MPGSGSSSVHLLILFEALSRMNRSRLKSPVPLPFSYSIGAFHLIRVEGAGSFKSRNFVQSFSEEDEQCSWKNNRDVVHVLLIKNKTFVTMKDARGNNKTRA